jgi:hypothetical protein
MTDKGDVASFKDHRLVKNSYGCDVVLRHEPSRVNIHLRSQFLGGMTEAFINERLGRCKHIPLTGILAFFDVTSYQPGRVSVAEITHRRWVAFVLVSDLLDLPYYGPLPGVEITESEVQLTCTTIKSILDVKGHHRPHIIDELVLSICGFIGDGRNRTIARRCFSVIKSEYRDRCDMLMNCSFLLGGGGSYGIVTTDSDALNADKLNLGAVRMQEPSFVLNIVSYMRNEMKSVAASNTSRRHTCTAVYIVDKSATYDDMPFEIEPSPSSGNAFDLILKPTSAAFGQALDNLVVNDIAIVPFDRRNVHLLQKVVVSGRTPDRITAVPFVFLSARLSYGDTYLTDDNDAHVVSCTFPEATSASYLAFGLRPDVDPFQASRNFVIRVEGGASWLLHDWVLYERWSYFRRVVDAGLAEATERTITLPPEFPSRLLYTMLYFIYTSQIDATLAELAEMQPFVKENAVLYGLAARDDRGALFCEPGWTNFMAQFYKMKREAGPTRKSSLC